jgi:hypothetical protein
MQKPNIIARIHGQYLAAAGKGLPDVHTSSEQEVQAKVAVPGPRGRSRHLRAHEAQARAEYPHLVGRETCRGHRRNAAGRIAAQASLSGAHAGMAIAIRCHAGRSHLPPPGEDQPEAPTLPSAFEEDHGHGYLTSYLSMSKTLTREKTLG